MYKDRSHC